MKKVILMGLLGSALLSTNVMAREDMSKFEIAPLLKSDKAKNAILDIPLYCADQSYPAAKRTLTDMTTSQKTNAFNK